MANFNVVAIFRTFFKHYRELLKDALAFVLLIVCQL